MNIIDFENFEELFKTGNQTGLQKNADAFSITNTIKKAENVTLLDAQRQRNLGGLLFVINNGYSIGSTYNNSIFCCLQFFSTPKYKYMLSFLVLLLKNKNIL